MASVAVSVWRRPAPAGRGRPASRVLLLKGEVPVQLSDLKGLFLTNRRRLLSYLLAHGAGDAAEDLLHDLWLRVEGAPPPPDPSIGYLMRMAHNLMIDRARSTRQRLGRERAWRADGPMPSGDEDETPGAERVLLSRERLRLIDQSLEELGPRTKEILYRHRVLGVPQRTLADELNISLSAIEKQLQKAYKAIAAAQLAAEGGQDDR
jgi:RNA polymerase sigma factor (sigma-70 family)